MAIFKKAGMLDVTVAMILGFILVVCLVIMLFAQNTVHTRLLEVAPTLQKGMTANATDIINETVGQVSVAFQTFRWISIALVIGYFLSVLVSAFLVKTHPAWFIGYALMNIIAVVISVYISNTYEALLNNDILAGTFYEFGMANFVFSNMPYVIAVIGFVAGILMYINLDWGSSYG